MMQLIQSDDYESMSQIAAEFVWQVIREKPTALLACATGSSPLRLYQLLAQHADTATNALRIMGIDEWHGIDREHPATCRSYLYQNVIRPLDIPPSQQFLFDAAAPDPVAECQRMQTALQDQGGMDLCILGLGRNGHLALNEPGEQLRPHAHVAQLDPLTQTHPMLQSEGVTVTHGLTFGIADFLQARRIILLITGEGKTEAARAFLKGNISTQLPASFLHLHPNTTVVIDNTVIP